MEDFKDGDVVQLKSGGPKMTVDSWDEELGVYHCSWFAGDELKNAAFESTSLQKFNPKDPSSYVSYN